MVGMKVLGEIVSDDERGMMTKLIADYKTLWFICTNRGYGRGGEEHPVTQFCTIISGKVQVNQLFEDGTETIETFSAGSIVKIPKNVKHVFIALEDTIIIEWHDGQLPPFKDKKIYEPYRKLCWKNHVNKRGW
jgi:hypothetical protein